MLRRTPLRRRRATVRRSGRVRDLGYLAWVHTLTCAAAVLPSHYCEGGIEADHVGARGLGQKCSDFGQIIPLCTIGHRQRTDHCGPFREFTREDMRAFVAQALADTAAAYARHTAGADRTEAT